MARFVMETNYLTQSASWSLSGHIALFQLSAFRHHFSAAYCENKITLHILSRSFAARKRHDIRFVISGWIRSPSTKPGTPTQQGWRQGNRWIKQGDEKWKWWRCRGISDVSILIRKGCEMNRKSTHFIPFVAKVHANTERVGSTTIMTLAS